jgi:hypothetical protein
MRKFTLVASLKRPSKKLRTLNERIKSRNLQRFLTVSEVTYNRVDLHKHITFVENLDLIVHKSA